MAAALTVDCRRYVLAMAKNIICNFKCVCSHTHSPTARIRLRCCQFSCFPAKIGYLWCSSAYLTLRLPAMLAIEKSIQPFFLYRACSLYCTGCAYRLSITFTNFSSLALWPTLQRPNAASFEQFWLFCFSKWAFPAASGATAQTLST